MLVVKFCNIVLWGCYVMYAFQNIDQKMMISNFNETISRFLSCFLLGGQNYIDASGNYTLFFCINIKKMAPSCYG